MAHGDYFVGYIFTSPQVVTAVEIDTGVISGTVNETVDVQYSDDTTNGTDGTWTTLDVSPTLLSNQTYSVPITTPGNHLAYRIFHGAAFGTINPIIKELRLLSGVLNGYELTFPARHGLQTDDYVLISNSSNPLDVPNGMRKVIRVDDYVIGLVGLSGVNPGSVDVTTVPARFVVIEDGLGIDWRGVGAVRPFDLSGVHESRFDAIDVVAESPLVAIDGGGSTVDVMVTDRIDGKIQNVELNRYYGLGFKARLP